MKNPKHIAIIMDGSGRWAKKKFLPRASGHKAGAKTVKHIIECSLKNNIQELSLFAFSTENWRRPESEVSFLMGLYLRALETEANFLYEQNVRIKVIGDLSPLSPELIKQIKHAEALTQTNDGLLLNVALNYGGRWDIIEACKKLVAAKVDVKQIDDNCFNNYLAVTSAPDLLIRTSGETRISNFLLWQLAYTELYFTQVLWPDFKEYDFNQALEWYQTRQKRYGKTPEQVERLNALV